MDHREQTARTWNIVARSAKWQRADKKRRHMTDREIQEEKYRLIAEAQKRALDLGLSPDGIGRNWTREEAAVSNEDRAIIELDEKKRAAAAEVVE